ncbi:MAG: sodium:solute symporter family protein [Bacillota bacterium]|nr:sodium:solute symporter family protein [Bacillota bacterium]
MTGPWSFAVGVFVSFALYVAVGNYAGARVKTLSDYYVSGRAAPTILVVGTLVASYLSTVCFMGEVGFSYQGYLLPLLTLAIMSGAGYPVGSIYFGRYLRRSQALTVPEYFGKRFNSPLLRIIMGTITVVGIGCYLVAVNQGLGLLLSELLGIPYRWALVIAFVVYGSFTFYAGSRGVIITDTIMFLAFTLAALLVVPFILSAAGGWHSAVESLSRLPARPDILKWHGLTGEGAIWANPSDALVWAFLIGVIWFLVVGTSPWQASRYQMAASEHVVLRSGIVAMLAFSVMYLVLQFGAASVAVINPNVKPFERVLIWASMNPSVVPTWLGVLTICAIFAAGLSSCSTFLSLVGFSLAYDILPFVRRGQPAEERFVLRVSRICMGVVALIAMLLTLSPPPAILWIAYFAATLFAASWGLLAFASVHWPRVTRAGAIASVLLGSSGVVVMQALKSFGRLSLPIYLDPTLVGIVLSAVGMVAGSLLTRPTPEEMDYRRGLLAPVESVSASQWITTRNYYLAGVAVGIVLVIGLYVFYYLPAALGLAG